MTFKLASWIQLVILSLLLFWITERSTSQPIAIPTELTADEIQQIVRAHNYFRSMVEPSASNMQQITWNSILAKVAQTYAGMCMFGPNLKRAEQAAELSFSGTVGENRAFGRSTNYTDLIERGWFAQRANFDFDNNMCFTQGVCDEYTQLVWAESSMVGCGVANCPEVQGLPILPNAVVLVCNYAPEGNVPGERPYEAGQPCSNCPPDMPVCVNNACSSKEDMVITTTTEEVPMTSTNTEPPPTTVTDKVRTRPKPCEEKNESKSSRYSSESDSESDSESS